MHPICIQIGPITIYWYGVMVAAGFLVGAWIATRRAGAYGIEPQEIADLMIWLILGGIIGARLAYVGAHLPEFMLEPLEIIRIDHGGLIFYGGLVGAVGATILFTRRRNLPLWNVADVLAVPLPVGHAIGRVGCLLNGCCYGRPTTLPWAVPIAGACRHPSEAYLSLGNLAVAGFVFWQERRARSGKAPRLRSGQLFWTYAAAYAVMRFVMEFFRGDYGYWLPGHFSVAQLLSVVLLIAALMLRSRVGREPGTES